MRTLLFIALAALALETALPEAPAPGDSSVADLRKKKPDGSDDEDFTRAPTTLPAEAARVLG